VKHPCDSAVGIPGADLIRRNNFFPIAVILPSQTDRRRFRRHNIPGKFIMGLDAFVRCDCWEKGLQVPPALKPHVYLDDEGSLALREPAGEDARLYDQFAEWRQSACPHEDMEYANERVANWAGVRIFSDLLTDLGRNRFSSLLQALPEGNGGQTSAIAARHMLSELDYLASLVSLGEKSVLVDSDSGEELYQASSAYDGRLAIGPTFHTGLDHEGFFVDFTARAAPMRRLAPIMAILRLGLTGRCPLSAMSRFTLLCLGLAPREVFRSKRFEQILLEPKKADNMEEDQWVMFRSCDGRQSLICDLPVSGDFIPWSNGEMEDEHGRMRFHRPRFLHFEQRERTRQEYDYIVQPLRVLCEAAIATGNPICWC